VKLEDNAAHSFGETSYPGVNMTQNYKEDILVGYRWHDTKKIKPLYAFGYGLSYTSFEVSDIEIDKKSYTQDDSINVSCTLYNTGNFDGSEVIQVYIGKPNSKVKRALKELKGYQKVKVKTGAKSKINIEIPLNSLAFYDETISDWSLEKGNYTIYVGNASNNIFKKIKISVK